MAKTLLANIKTFINQCIPDYIIDSWSNTAQTGKAPSENLVKTALNSKIDTAGTGLSKSGTSLAVNFGTNTNTVAQGDHTHSNYLTSLPSHNHDDRYYTEAEIQANYAEKTHTHPLDIGTFTELQQAVTYETDNGVLILDKDYKYDATTDLSLSGGIEITQDIIIIGNGHIIDGNNYARAFIDTDGYTWELNDLKIQNCINSNDNKNGYSDGGAIYVENGTTVNINNTQFTNNTADNFGGAIFAYEDANVNIKNSSFNDNTAAYNDIYSESEITVYECIIPNISTSCHNISNITIESLMDMIGDVITYINQ